LPAVRNTTLAAITWWVPLSLNLVNEAGAPSTKKLTLAPFEHP
jgi:hypothetical protein